MKYYLKAIALIIVPLAHTVNTTAYSNGHNQILERCKEMLNTGDWSNRYIGNSCTLNFDIPSPFTIKCLKRELANYEGLSKDLVRECHFHFRDDKKKIFKDFQDYDFNKDLPKELRLPFQILKRVYTVKL